MGSRINNLYNSRILLWRENVQWQRLAKTDASRWDNSFCWPLDCPLVLSGRNLHAQSVGWLVIQEVNIHLWKGNRRSNCSHCFINLECLYPHILALIRNRSFLFCSFLPSYFGICQQRHFICGLVLCIYFHGNTKLPNENLYTMILLKVGYNAIPKSAISFVSDLKQF